MTLNRGSVGTQSSAGSSISESENAPISSPRWRLLTFSRDAHLSSSLINNYSVGGPPDRPCILMTARAGAIRGGEREGAGQWSGVGGGGV